MEINWVKYFKCKKCWEVKPLNKCYFHINTMYSTGFNSKCKSCVKEERESKPKVKYITRAELEEENKKLNERVSELEDVSKDYDILSKDFITATWEIEFRKDEVERFKTNAVQDMAEITELENQIKNLKEKVETLELWLDNKEKLNEEYRKQLDKYKRQYEHSMWFMEEDTLQELRDIWEL